jgi:SAM-dependent methyltransferase
MEQSVAANDEATRAWDGPLFDRFLQFRHLINDGLGAPGAEVLRLAPPKEGERVLDVGCGFGETTQSIAAIVGPDGEAVGVDVSERFIELAREEGATLSNLRYEVADVEIDPLGEGFDMAYSRFGTMFFANPVAAMRNVRSALRPEGRLAMVVWRSKQENDWVFRAQQITERFVTKPEEYDEPTCGPGPFSMANADTTSGILISAGFTDISLRRFDPYLKVGLNLEEAIDFVMSLGPAGEILRLAGERAEHLHDDVRAALGEEFREWAGADGVWAPASTWIVTARAADGAGK